MTALAALLLVAAPLPPEAVYTTEELLERWVGAVPARRSYWYAENAVDTNDRAWRWSLTLTSQHDTGRGSVTGYGPTREAAARSALSGVARVAGIPSRLPSPAP